LVARATCAENFRLRSNQIPRFLSLFKCVHLARMTIHCVWTVSVSSAKMHHFTPAIPLATLSVCLSQTGNVWSNSSETQFIILTSSAYLYIKEISLKPPVSFRQTSNQSPSHTSFHSWQFMYIIIISTLLNSFFHFRLKTHLFDKSFPQETFGYLVLPSRTYHLGYQTPFRIRTYYAHRFVLFSRHYLFLVSDPVW